MRVEMGVEFRSERRAREAEAQEPSDHEISRSRDRQLYWLALAMHIEELVLSGQVKSYAEIARMCDVSRARVSTVAGMLGMAVVAKDKLLTRSINIG